MPSIPPYVPKIIFKDYSIEDDSPVESSNILPPTPTRDDYLSDEISTTSKESAASYKTEEILAFDLDDELSDGPSLHDLCDENKICQNFSSSNSFSIVGSLFLTIIYLCSNASDLAMHIMNKLKSWNMPGNIIEDNNDIGLYCIETWCDSFASELV